MITRIENLDPYYLSGNIPEILIPEVTETLEVEIKIEREGYDPVIIVEEHDVTAEEYVLLNISDLVHNELEFYIADQPSPSFVWWWVQEKAVATVTITPDGFAPAQFIAVKGSLDTEDETLNFLTFMQQNTLNIGPQIRQVRGDEPVFFNFFSDEQCVVKVSAFNLETGFPDQKDYFSQNTRDTLVTFNATFNDVVAKLWPDDDRSKLTRLEFLVRSTESTNQTYIMRLEKNEEYREFSDYFLFENSIGGLETIHLTGEKTEELRHQTLRAKIRTLAEGTHEREYQTIPLVAYIKNTGWIYNEQQRQYILDFLASSMRYHYQDGKFRRIYLLDYDGRTTPGQLNSKTFTYAYSRQYTGRFPTRKTLNPWVSG